MFVLNCLILIAIILWIHFLWTRRKYYFLWYQIGGPLGYPFVGMAIKLMHPDKIIRVLREMEEIYGTTFFSWLGPKPFLVVSDPETAEQILTTPDILEKSQIYDMFDRAFGNGLFTSTGSKWTTHRRLLNPAFRHKVLLSFIPIFNKEADKLNLVLDEFVDKGDIQTMYYFQKCTFGIAAQTTMGKQLSNTVKEQEILNESYQLMLNVLTRRGATPWLMNEAIFKMTSVYESYDKARNHVNNFTNNLIEEKLEILEKNRNIKHQHNNNDESDDIIKHNTIFIDQAIQLLQNGHFTTSNVRDESNVMILAAYETTANTLNNIIYCLAMHPEYQDKVFEEILSIFPERNFNATYEDIQHMVYTEMVINETMRVISTVPLAARTVTKDFKLSNGIILPKGLQVAIDIFNMQRNEKFWGPDAKIFNPEHFLPNNIIGKHPYSFIPFTKGIRSCIGSRYAMISMKIMLAKILRNYKLTTEFKFENLEFVENITIQYKKMPLLKIHRRNK